MRRAFRPLRIPLLLGTFAISANPLAAPPALPLFSVDAPRKMVTGPIVVQAHATDPKVALVKWFVDDWARTTPPPFELPLNIGPFPVERRVRAVALDQGRHPLYERGITLNPGARGLDLSFVTPLGGQQVSGDTGVTLEAIVPADDEVDRVELEADDGLLPLSPITGAEGLFGTVARLPETPLPLLGRLVTKRGRRVEATVVVNARGPVATTGAHVVDQMVGVLRGSDPVTSLSPRDFDVKDDAGECEVRSIALVRDTPLALGFAVDTSLSLRHNEKLLSATADQFLAQCFRPTDAGFVLAFGPVISKLAGWTSDRSLLKSRLDDLPETEVAGTAFYETIVRALYEFQGSQGARALIVITDGYDFDGDVSEEDALAYAKQSGVKIYALALSTRTGTATVKTAKDGTSQTKWRFEIEPPNMAVLARFAEATGGRAFEVKRAEDLGPSFERIEKDLRTQYLVSFATKAKPRGGFHPVEIQARRGHVVTAAGYFY